jgi:integrase
MTVNQAVENYLNHRAQSHDPLPSNQITNYERVANDWGNFLVSDLRNEDLANYITELVRTPLKWVTKQMENGPFQGVPQTYAVATVRKFIYAMKVAIEWQAKNGKVRINEFLFDFDRGVIPAAWAGHRERRLNPGEEARLYEAGLTRSDITYTPDDWRALIGFALETAMRQQELAMAEWRHISASGLQLNIPAKNTKTKTSRNILLSQKAREILNLQRKTCPEVTNRIFHQFSSAGSICDSFASLAARAKVEDLTFHDLRHEATSRLCESGKLNQMVIMEMTGHNSLTTFRGYVHLINDHNGVRLD